MMPGFLPIPSSGRARRYPVLTRRCNPWTPGVTGPGKTPAKSPPGFDILRRWYAERRCDCRQHRREARPCELTDDEVFQLMRAYTRDKTCITEEDALTLCHWAQAQKFGAYVLQLVLAGSLRVTVDDGTVKLGLPHDPARLSPLWDL